MVRTEHSKLIFLEINLNVSIYKKNYLKTSPYYRIEIVFKPGNLMIMNQLNEHS